MKIVHTLIIGAIVSASALQACPTCVGKVGKNSPPFFSKEYEASYRINRKKVSLKTQEKSAPTADKNPAQGAQS